MQSWTIPIPTAPLIWTLTTAGATQMSIYTTNPVAAGPHTFTWNESSHQYECPDGPMIAPWTGNRTDPAYVVGVFFEDDGGNNPATPVYTWDGSEWQLFEDNSFPDAATEIPTGNPYA